jgi:hypothetical protein
LFGVLFYLLLVLLVSDRYHLDDAIYGNLQDFEDEDFEQQQSGNPGKCSLTILILCALPLVHTIASPCSRELSYKSSIFYDVEFGL